jgi:hypothetical protein
MLSVFLSGQGLQSRTIDRLAAYLGMELRPQKSAPATHHATKDKLKKHWSKHETHCLYAR